MVSGSKVTGSSSRQLRFSEEPRWKEELPLLNSVLPPLPFIGTVSRLEPAVRTCIETRRKDVGQQAYPSGNYQPSFIKEPVIGTLPTVDAIFFLRDEYGDSSQPICPSRFFR
jgi:hypothetical protein